MTRVGDRYLQSLLDQAWVLYPHRLPGLLQWEMLLIPPVLIVVGGSII